MRKQLAVLILLVSIPLKAQITSNPNTVGINHTISSTVLKEERQIQVYVPDGYKNSNKKYPVIYLLDGQRFFLYGVSLYQSFSAFNLTPDFIVVGITNSHTKRMRTFSYNSDNFLSYLEKEVVPFVNQTYRTNNRRLLFGWAYGGGFGLKAFTKTPNLFDGYILSSTFPVSSKLVKLKALVTEQPNLKNYLYFSADQINENSVFDEVLKLDALLQKSSANLRWHFHKLQGEKHRSTPYTSLYHGILEYFENYQNISFNDLAEFNAKGGLKNVYAYYTKRSELYNLPNEISSFTKFHIIRLAIRAKNYQQFQELVEEFDQETLIKGLRESFLCTIGEFYIDNGKTKEATSFYNLLIKKFPNSKRIKETLKKLNN